MVVDKKSAILKSVLKLVNRQGFYHLNMKSIATEAKIAAGTIYLYFKGKEDLINALYSMIMQEFNTYVLASYDEQKSVKENFYAMIRDAVTFYLKHPDHFSFVEQYTYAPFLFKENQEQNFALLLPIYKLMNLGKKEGIVKPIEDSILLSIIHGALNTIIKLHLAKKTNLKQEATQKEFYDAVWFAIAK